MPFRDQREFIDVLRAHGELVDIDRYVDLYCDVGRVLRKSNARGGPAFRTPAFGMPARSHPGDLLGLGVADNQDIRRLEVAIGHRAIVENSQQSRQSKR